MMSQSFLVPKINCVEGLWSKKNCKEAKGTPNHEILGVQHSSFDYDTMLQKVSIPSCPKAKVRSLWHPGTSSAESCVVPESITTSFPSLEGFLV